MADIRQSEERVHLLESFLFLVCKFRLALNCTAMGGRSPPSPPNRAPKGQNMHFPREIRYCPPIPIGRRRGGGVRKCLTSALVWPSANCLSWWKGKSLVNGFENPASGRRAPEFDSAESRPCTPWTGSLQQNSPNRHTEWKAPGRGR